MYSPLVDKVKGPLDYVFAKKLTISVAESLTGGLLSSILTERPGSSEILIGGICPYSIAAKEYFLAIKNTIDLNGVVSPEVAKAMAEEIRHRLDTDIGLSTTGIAGPDGGTKLIPVGTVFIGLANRKKTVTYRLQLTGNRTEIRELTVIEILSRLADFMDK